MARNERRSTAALQRQFIHGKSADTKATKPTKATGGAKATKPSADAVRNFARAAKVGGSKRRPFDGLEPHDEESKKGMTLRTNAYERAVLRYYAAVRSSGSVQKLLTELIHGLVEDDT